jgi:hypothetical protein
MSKTKYYAVSDGTKATAEKIKEFLSAQKPLPGEVDKYSYDTIRIKYFWVDAGGVIRFNTRPPEGFTEFEF